MITISKEDYLKAIAEAEAEGQLVIPATLAHWLSVTRPAVTFALKRLTKDKLVAVTKEGRVRLTPQGREVAERTMVRHHLIERMLSEIFDMPWYEIHDEAERLEHAVSPAFEKKLIGNWGTGTPVRTEMGWLCAVRQSAERGGCTCSARWRQVPNMRLRVCTSATANYWNSLTKKVCAPGLASRWKAAITMAQFPYHWISARSGSAPRRRRGFGSLKHNILAIVYYN